MTVGICGLGLIGGSMAKAYKESGHRVLGYDINDSTLGYCSLAGITDGVLDESTIGECELLFVALYPVASIKYLEDVARLINKNATVIDLCGTKAKICECGFALAKQYGFTFVGGHPMAGTQYSGIKYARASLFKNAPMVLVPPIYDDISFLDKIKQLLAPAGFGRFSVTTAQKHDEMIAFTSQLAHVVSNAYVKTPTAQNHKGFSAGSYKDMTRVAWLNENMWTELFLENREPLLYELDNIISSLSEYRDAIANEDADTLRGLLRDGRIAKEKVDG
ncbi:MAG: prephenate dehydrogenase/arogenate dehydrogenase family protein [Ruminococcaceae bacterium]|nr:prephenate dehydrogenase/arogenate dehydrogenase family protein [Oscillospiraceae bacterium]